MKERFNLDVAVATWRRFILSDRAISADDADELETHLRDEIDDLVASGLPTEAAFRQATKEMGMPGGIEKGYQKVFWTKLKHEHRTREELNWRMAMFANYLKLTLRNIRKEKGYAFINIFGLSLGIGAAVLLMLVVRFELSWDDFHEQAERIYQVGERGVRGESSREFFITRTPALPLMIEEIPEVVGGSRVFTQSHWVGNGDVRQKTSILHVDSLFFDTFTFPALSGNPRAIFSAPGTVALSESRARQLFGDEDPVGQSLDIDLGDASWTVVAVLADPPVNSSIQFEMVAWSLNAPSRLDETGTGHWYNSNMPTYILLTEGANMAEVDRKLQDFEERRYFQYEDEEIEIILRPMTDGRLASTTQKAMLLLVGIIALMIPLIAGINFTNLSIARSLRRTREVGMRKVLGANRTQLMGQFLGESLLITFISMAFGALLALVLLPTFNSTFGLQIPSGLFLEWDVVVLFLVFGVTLGILSGFYPAVILSRHTPVGALKPGRNRRMSGQMLRRSLVVSQFAFSAILLIATVVVWKQIDFMKTRDLAINTDNVLVVGASTWDMERPEAALQGLRSIASELSTLTAVEGVSFSQVVPGRYWEQYNTYLEPGDAEDEAVRLRQAWVDGAYFDTFGMRLIEGRTFSEQISGDVRAIVINEAARKAYGWESAVGKQILSGGSSGNPMEVIGVVSDYHYQSLQRAIEPVVHFYAHPEFTGNNWMSVAIAPGRTEEVMAEVERAWPSIGTATPLQYFFLDEGFNELYRMHRLFGTTVGVFAGLSILIACMGLIALVALATQHRTKEIGIRKAMGASGLQVVTLVSREFVLLLTIALVIAIPATWVGMDRWLQDFAYRAPLNVWLFLSAALGMFLLAGLAVGFQTVRAARLDPVLSLRHE